MKILLEQFAEEVTETKPVAQTQQSWETDAELQHLQILFQHGATIQISTIGLDTSCFRPTSG